MTRIRKADYFKVDVANKAGEAARLLQILKESGVNLVALTGFPRGRRAQIDFMPEDTPAFKKAMKKAKINVGQKKTVFLIQGSDRVGAMAEVMEKLGKAGINVVATDAVTDGRGGFGAILWVKSKDVSRTARVLGAS